MIQTFNKGGIKVKSSYGPYVPERFMGRTGYQIFVDRFCRKGLPPKPMEGRILKEWSDAEPNWWPDEDGEYRNRYFYGGNLQGVISKLDYLQSMGFDLIYLSPISFTHTSHHYDVEDQLQIDPWIGTWDDFSELCCQAHERNILICADLVFNHMGVQSKYFQEALKNKNSRYHEWFEWDETGNPVFWYGFKDMPQCNKRNPDYQQYAYSVAEYYIKMGSDGIRLDLGENFPKEFMEGLRKRVKSIETIVVNPRGILTCPEALLVSEMWDFATHKENPQIFGDQVDSVMNYPMADAICRWVRYGNAKHLEYTWREISEYPIQVQNVLWNFLDSHDTPRAANMLVGIGMNENPFSGRIWDIEAPWRNGDQFDTLGFRTWEAEHDHVDEALMKKRLILASLLQYFVKGIPIVYYGTENGLTGNKDPFNRKPYVWERQNDIMRHYQELGKFRKANKDILARGDVIELRANDSTLLMIRESEVGELILVMNRTEYNQENPIRNCDTNDWREEYKVGESTRDMLMPYSAVVYRTDY